MVVAAGEGEGGQIIPASRSNFFLSPQIKNPSSLKGRKEERQGGGGLKGGRLGWGILVP
jgi:hypothetical protein